MLVLDANILIRAVLGRRVRELLERYAVRGVRFLAPEAAFEEASKYLPMLLEKRGIPGQVQSDTAGHWKANRDPILPPYSRG
jgi:predicted nucleic acid-binding protein